MDKIYKRKIYDDMLRWKRESHGESALLIEGPRRIQGGRVAHAYGEVGIWRDYRNVPKRL